MRTATRLFSLLAAFVVLVGSATQLFADAPKPPVEFNAGLVTQVNGSPYVKIQWYANREGTAATSFDIYMASSETEDMSLFDKIGSVEVAANTQVYTFKKTDLKAGVYTFFVKAVNADGESERTKIIVVVVKEISNDPMIKITSAPVKTGKVDVAYKYAVKFEKNFEGTGKFKIENAPDGMVIDEATGIISWDKPVKGRYEIKVTVSVELNGAVKSATQIYVLEIGEEPTNEKGCVTVSGTVKWDDATINETVNSGTVIGWKLEVVKKEDGTTKEVYTALFKVKIERGMYTMNVPAGTYKFRVEGEYFDAEWYEDVKELADAKTVVVKCDEPKVEVNFSVAARKAAVTVVASGRVTDENGNGMKAVVIFEAKGKDGANVTIKRVAAETNADGYYEVKLESGVNYIGFAKAAGDKKSAYAMEFWKESADATTATVLNITANEDGVNFTLELLPVYDNSISGTLVDNKTGDKLTGKVVAYQIIASDNPNGESKKAMIASVETDADGAYTISNLKRGNYIVYGAASERKNVPGWYVSGEAAVEKWSKATVLEVGETSVITDIKIQLLTATGNAGKGRARGWVYDKRGGIAQKPTGEVQGQIAIVGALIVARDANGTIVDYAVTENEGAYLLTELAVGTTTLSIDRFGFENENQTIVIDGQNVEVQASFGLVSKTSDVEVPTNVGTTLNLYPNPTAANATLKFDAVNGNASVRILTASGVVMSVENFSVTTGPTTLTINSASLPAGMFLVQVTNGNASFALPMSIVK
ncbi:MAG: T9SS type A sorting domain-containing protein [Ignavibacteria bacterium]|nr:T9SS type A sorting domain-containing protein [Ignavibacteria bacterium]